MLKLRRVDIERSGEIFKGIEAYREKVVSKLNPKRIILFGSFARGDFNEGSDIDLIVIADWKEGFLDRIKTLMEMNDLKLPIEPIGYTEEEFEEMIRKGNPFILKVLEEGVVIYQGAGVEPVCGSV